MVAFGLKIYATLYMTFQSDDQSFKLSSCSLHAECRRVSRPSHTVWVMNKWHWNAKFSDVKCSDPSSTHWPQHEFATETHEKKRFGQDSQWRVETVPRPVPDVFQDVRCTNVARHLRRLSSSYHTSQTDLWYLAISGLQDHCYYNFLANKAWWEQTQIRNLSAIDVHVVRDVVSSFSTIIAIGWCICLECESS